MSKNGINGIHGPLTGIWHIDCGEYYMATAHAFFPIRRTMGQLTFYVMDGKNYVRKKSSLTAKKVKTSPRFERTRYYAGLMATASRIGSQIYKALPPGWRQSWMYRAFTGEAIGMLKSGKKREEVIDALWKLYVEPMQQAVDRWSDTALPVVPVSQKRAYRKKATTYWNRKSEKAGKRKAKREKLHYNAGLMARASVIGSRVYRMLPVDRRKDYVYRAITGCAMRLLKYDVADEQVKKLLMNELLSGKYVGKKKVLFVIPLMHLQPVTCYKLPDAPIKRSTNKNPATHTGCTC